MKKIYLFIIALICFCFQFIFPFFKINYSPELRFLSNGLIYLIVPFVLLRYKHCNLKEFLYFFATPSVLMFIVAFFIAIYDNSYTAFLICIINLFSLAVVYFSYKLDKKYLVYIGFIIVLISSFFYKILLDKKFNGRYMKSPFPISKLEIEKEYNFGKIFVGDTVTHKFKITNNSEEDLVIKKVGKSCTCTSVGYLDSIIKPKQSSFFELQFVPKKKQIGEVSSSVAVSMNTTPSFVILKMKGIVENK